MTSSDTFMVPSSAAIAEPTVAARMTPVMNGPISRHIVSAVTVPMMLLWPNLRSSMPVCRARIMPANSATTRVTGRARTPAA